MLEPHVSLRAVVTVDERGTIREANGPLLALTGHPALIGQPFTTIVPRRFHARHQASFARQLHGAGLAARLVRLPLLRVDGEEVTADLTIRVHRPRRALVVARSPARRLVERADNLV